MFCRVFRVCVSAWGCKGLVYGFGVCRVERKQIREFFRREGGVGGVRGL